MFFVKKVSFPAKTAVLTAMSFGISSVAHHNLHMNTIFVYLFMQELFVDKIHFFKFLCMSDKPRLHQLNIITSSRSRYKLPWLPEYFHSYGEIPSRKGKYPILKTNTKPRHLIKLAKISYSIASLVFCKFSYQTYRNGLNQVPQSWGSLSISKSTNRVSSISFVGNPHFSVLLQRVRYLENLFISRR